MFSVFGPNPLTLLFVCTISGAAMIYSIKLEASALKEKKIDVSQGSKTGNALAKWLGIGVFQGTHLYIRRNFFTV